MRTLLIDNYDSFTWNLAHYIAEISGEEPLVVFNETYSWNELMRMGPFDCIVLSPGPGTVLKASDFRVSRAAIENAQVPLLGVCLGHQGIGHMYGAEVLHAPEPVHGRTSLVYHDGDPLFDGIPSPWQVVRYHSLTVGTPLPAQLNDIARTSCGVLMGLRHRSRPLWGVQFHPESILTEHGMRLMRNFRDITYRELRRSRTQVQESLAAARPRGECRVLVRALQSKLSAEDLFVGLFAADDNAFWLDSALLADGPARFSYLGTAGTEGVRTFSCSSDAVDRQREGNAFLDDLQARLSINAVSEIELPFPFRGGWIGFFGYEMKALFGAEAVHRSEYPDSAWLHADRFIAIDHHTNRMWAVIVAPQSGEAAARHWLEEFAERVELIDSAPCVAGQHSTDELIIELDQSRNEYLESIAACHGAIRDGESYQVCLTNKMTYAAAIDGLSLYRELRKSNPAPFAAYLRIGELEIISASPERFLSVDLAGRIEAKPIKGTIRRDENGRIDEALSEELRMSEKNRAENLMIVDLLRNDLSRVAEIGSVRVPNLMQIESYATLHQLVSTVTAQLRPECGLIDLIRATFPGGSITGAPKLRTMQIIDALERSARGVYCGAIGYLGYNRLMDLNVAIRTIVCYRNVVSFGVGGGVTHLSDASDEFDEILLKAYALIRALCHHKIDQKEVRYRLVGKTDRESILPTQSQTADQRSADEPLKGLASCSVS